MRVPWSDELERAYHEPMTRAQMGRTLGDRLQLRALELYPRERVRAARLPFGAAFDWWADGPGRRRITFESMGLDPDRVSSF